MAWRGTEVERVVSKGVVNREFLEPEERDGFLVDARRKAIWAVELDLLLELDRACRELGLRYFLAFGTLLGAVRHGGFIPWDDDVDVFMPREDYESLRKVKSAFREPYFLQYPGEDDGYYFSFAKLRNSGTSGVSVPFMFQGFNQGLFVDIFPLDACDEGRAREVDGAIAELIGDQSNYMRREYELRKGGVGHGSRRWSGRDPGESCLAISKLAISSGGGHSSLVAPLTSVVYPLDRRLYSKGDFRSAVGLSLEGPSFAAPAGYDRVLRTTYGDYRLFPPVEQRGSWHATTAFDPYVPYEKLLKKMRSELQLPAYDSAGAAAMVQIGTAMGRSDDGASEDCRGGSGGTRVP